MPSGSYEKRDFRGGCSLNKKLGSASQFAYGLNCDFRSVAGLLTCATKKDNKLTLSASEDLPCEFTHQIETRGGDFYLLGDNNVIYKRSGNTITIVDNTGAEAGSGNGLIEFEDYLLRFRDTTIDRYGPLSGSPSIENSWKTGLQDSADHQPLFKRGSLWIPNGRYLALIDSDFILNKEALDLPSEFKIKQILDAGEDLIALPANKLTSTGDERANRIYLWSLISKNLSYDHDDIKIPEKYIQAGIGIGGLLYIWAGESASLYVINPLTREMKRLIGFYRSDPSQKFSVYTGAVIIKNGTIYFGLSNVNQNSSGRNKNGVYSFNAGEFPIRLNQEYLGTNGYGEYFKSLGMNDDLLFVGIKLTNKHLIRESNASDSIVYAEATIEGFIQTAPLNQKIYTKLFSIDFEKLLVGTSVKLYYKKDSGSWTLIDTANTVGDVYQKKIKELRDIRELQLEVVLTPGTSGNKLNRPFLKKYGFIYEIKQDPK